MPRTLPIVFRLNHSCLNVEKLAAAAAERATDPEQQQRIKDALVAVPPSVGGELDAARRVTDAPNDGAAKKALDDENKKVNQALDALGPSSLVLICLPCS